MAEDWGKFQVKRPSEPGQKQLGPSMGEMSIARRFQRIDEIKQKYTHHIRNSSKSLLLFDATGSMGPYWNVTMQRHAM